MFILLSPAKKIGINKQLPFLDYSIPSFVKQAENLITIMRKKSKKEIMELMSISASLAELNYQRYQDWSPTHTTDNNSLPTIFAFQGDVYQGFEAFSLTDEDINFANECIGILSGLYGLLKPLDLIQPYRLEMGTKLNNKKGKDLYSYWQPIIAKKINEQLNLLASKDKLVINLASNEYFKAVDTKLLDYKVITPTFKDYKNGVYKSIYLYAKQARGMMAKFIVKNRLSSLNQIYEFNYGGYKFNPEMSDKNKLVFTRKQ